MGAVSPEVARWPCWHFEIVLLGCPFAPSEAPNGKVQLYIKCLGGKVSDSEHFVMT